MKFYQYNVQLADRTLLLELKVLFSLIVTSKQPITSLKHQPLRTVLAELADLVVLEHAEGFAGVIGTHHISWVEDVAQLIASEAVEVRIEGIEFGAQQGAAFWVEDEGRFIVAEGFGPRLEVVAGVSEFEDAGTNKIDSVTVVGTRRKCWQLTHIIKTKVGTANFLSGNKVKYERT